ncbi:MAG: hypothetical protein Q9224_003558 [Gallowayella concinna]
MNLRPWAPFSNDRCVEMSPTTPGPGLLRQFTSVMGNGSPLEIFRHLIVSIFEDRQSYRGLLANIEPGYDKSKTKDVAQMVKAATISFPTGSTAYNLEPDGSNLRQVGLALELLSSHSATGIESGTSLRLQIPPSACPVKSRTRIFPDFDSTAYLFATLDTAPATSWRWS